MNTTISKAEPLYKDVFETASDGMLITDLQTGKILAANPAVAEMHGYARQAFNDLCLKNLIHSKSLPYFSDYAHVIQEGGLFEMQAQHVRQDKTLFNVEWRSVAIEYHGHVCALAILRDVSKRVLAEQQKRQRAGVRTHEQSALLEISQILASTLELQPGRILDQLAGLIKYTHAGIFTIEDSTLVTLAVRGREQLEQAAPFHIRLNGKKTLEMLFNDHQPIRIADIWSNDPGARSLRTFLDKETTILLEGVQSWMWVPLAVKDRIIGGIGVAHVKPNYFTLHHADLAMTIANQAAVTMVNAELREHAQTLAVLQERQRLAQNLHDAVNQSLFSAGLIAEVLPRLWERDPDEARTSLEDLRRLTRGAMAEMRSLLAELRPSVLTDSSLDDLLHQLANAFTGRTNITVTVTMNREGSLPAETQVVLYRICQEALNNIAKHANASHVEIDLKLFPGTPQASSSDEHANVSHAVEVGAVEMRISDDGLGFDPGELVTPGHYGLGMMLERAESVGAQLTFTSLPGHGTEVLLRWPGPIKKEAK
jgi:PAS domain S-box-containing protein